MSGPNCLSSGLVISTDLSCSSLKNFFPDSVFPVLFSTSFLLASRFTRLNDLNANRCRSEGDYAIYARCRVISFVHCWVQLLIFSRDTPMSIQLYPTSGSLPAEIILLNADSLISKCIEIAAITYWLHFYSVFVVG